MPTHPSLKSAGVPGRSRSKKKPRLEEAAGLNAGCGTYVRLYEDRNEPCHDPPEDGCGKALDALVASDVQIERSGLIAADEACGLRAGVHEWDGEALDAGEVASGRDRQDDGVFVTLLKLCWTR